MTLTLPNIPIRGKLEENVPLAPYTWFKVGGNADYLFRPADLDDLCLFLQHVPLDMPIMILGAASNMLIRDGGIRGVVIRLGKGFNQMQRLEGSDDIYLGAAVPDMNAALFAQKQGLEGAEFLRGIPGTIGGALRMNAGAYGSELKDIFKQAHGVTRAGQKVTLTAQEMQFSYRQCGQKDIFFTAMIIGLQPEDPEKIAQRMQEIMIQRENSQPVKSRTGGSTFKNPEGHKAWQLIDAAGCRGLRCGDAQISEQHCNFMINHGAATAKDIEDLGMLVQKRVFQKSGIHLEWEIKRLGETAYPK